MCACIHPCPPSPSQGWDDLVPSVQATCCSVSSRLVCTLCNSTDIKAKHVALRREDTHGRREASAHGGASAPTSPVSREKSLLLTGPQVSSAVSGGERPPTLLGALSLSTLMVENTQGLHEYER